MVSNQTANYFDSYDNVNVHELMLKDEPRVSKYREAILGSKKIFKDKIVLDVGSGTGILSIFCAQAGAKQVIGVEASKGIFTLSKALVKANNLTDKITLINGEIEKIELPNGIDKVDIIVSEWMGMYLVHESMLDSVLFARDKWLKEDGLMYPSVAYLYVCPVEMENYLNQNLKAWFNYYDLNFEPMAKVFKQVYLEKPIVETIESAQMIDEEKILASFDLKTVKIEDLQSIRSFNVDFVANQKAILHGFAFWFDVIFTTDENIVVLKTGPDSAPTHWKQTIAFLPNALDLFINNNNENNKEELLQLEEDDQFECYVIMNQSEENRRHYVIDIGVNLNKDTQLAQGEDDEDEDESDDDDDYDADEEHPMPCDCRRMRCILIKATLQKYENESSSHENKE